MSDWRSAFGVMDHNSPEATVLGTHLYVLSFRTASTCSFHQLYRRAGQPRAHTSKSKVPILFLTLTTVFFALFIKSSIFLLGKKKWCDFEHGFVTISENSTGGM